MQIADSSMACAFVFPGQGAQVVGMGRDLVSESAAARAIYAEADATLGWSLSQLCFDGPAEQLMATENAQPAILATSIALLAALAEAHDATLVEFVAAHAQFVAG